MDTQENLRPKQAAEFLGIGLSTVWLYIRQNKLKAVKLSDRVTVLRKADLIDFTESKAEFKTGGSCLQNMRASDASKYLGVSKGALWLYARRGLIKPIKLSDRVTIFKRDDLDNFIENMNTFTEVK